MEKTTITSESKRAAERLAERGYNVLSARVTKGTMTAEQAESRAAEIDRESGNDIKSGYILAQALKGASRAAHSAENFSGGFDMFRERAQELERENAIYSNRNESGYRVHADESESMPECYDMIQNAALGILESGDYMTARGGSPLVSKRKRGGGYQAAAETYGYTHRAAADGARRAIRRYAVQSAVESTADWLYQRADNDQATNGDDIGQAEPSYTESALDGLALDGREHAAITAAAVSQFAVDIVHIVTDWERLAALVWGADDERAASYPSQRDIARLVKAASESGKAARLGIDESSIVYFESRSVGTIQKAIDRAFTEIAKSGGAALRAALISDISERRGGAVRIR